MRRSHLLAGSLYLTLVAWAVWLWGPTGIREVALGFAQMGTAGTLLLGVGALLEARRAPRGPRRGS